MEDPYPEEWRSMPFLCCSNNMVGVNPVKTSISFSSNCPPHKITFEAIHKWTKCTNHLLSSNLNIIDHLEIISIVEILSVKYNCNISKCSIASSKGTSSQYLVVFLVVVFVFLIKVHFCLLEWIQEPNNFLK